MLRAKPCHGGLQRRTRVFGLEPLDVLLLFPGLFLCAIVLRELVAGVVLTLVMGAAIRLLKWGRLPGYTLALLRYLVLPQHNAALGYDRAPLYPISNERKPAS